MREIGLDWLIAFHPVSIHWLTGSDAKSYQEFQCLLISSSSCDVTVLARSGERNEFREDALVENLHVHGGGENEDPISHFITIADELGLKKGRVGMEVPTYYLHPYHHARVCSYLQESLVKEPCDLIHELKMVKSDKELEYIRGAAAIADGAMEVFAQALRPGRTELEVAADVYQVLIARGGLAASPMNLVSGERSWYSHGAPTHRVLRRGDFGSIEYGAVFHRYTSTIGRQFCLGPPSSRMQELLDVVRRASDECIRHIRDGVPATEPHAAAKRVIQEAGLEHARVHTTGYGLAPGFPPSWSEPIHMIGENPYILREGMVITVEPPVFLDEERLGARIIDNVIVLKNGAERLSKFSRDLIVVD